MTRWGGLMAVTAALLGVLWSLAAPTPAYACSGDGDPVQLMNVIVAGRVTDIVLAPDLEGRGTPRTLAVRVRFEVDRYLKGSGPDVIEAFDVASAEFPFDVPESQWIDANIDLLEYHGASGACGALDEDPREQYWVAGLLREPDGKFLMHRFGRFAIADSAEDPSITERIAMLEEALSAILPASTGNAGLTHQSGQNANVPAVAVIAVAVALALLAGARHATSNARRRG